MCVLKPSDAEAINQAAQEVAWQVGCSIRVQIGTSTIPVVKIGQIAGKVAKVLRDELTEILAVEG